MKYQDTLYIAELGLKGDKKKLLEILKKYAADASNRKQYSLYHGLKTIINEGYKKTSFEDSSLIEDKSDIENERFFNNLPEKIWLPKRLEYQIDTLLKLYQYRLSSKNLQRRLNKILLYGPPGTGKTTLGFYIAKKLKRQIEYIKVSDVISAKFGETMKNLANVFHTAKDKVIFIDEFDAFAKSRTDSNDIGELKRIVSSLIQTLDFYSSTGIVIVATNLIESLDPAILRRFPYRILVDTLDKEEQSEFLSFTMNSNPDIKFNLTKSDRKFLESLIYSFSLSTVDQIQQLLDKTIMSALVNNENEIGINRFIDTLLSSDYINQRTVKNFKKNYPPLLQKIAKTMEQRGYAKTYISELLGIHRNSYKGYVEQ